MSKSDVKKNFALAEAFSSYILTHDRLRNRTPRKAYIVLGSAADKPLTQKNLELAYAAPDGRRIDVLRISDFAVPAGAALGITGPSGSFASIPSDGTALHPHIRLSTKPPDPADSGVSVPDFPTNTVREFMASVHNNSFGDDFSLNAPELGGHTKGRSHLVGRFQVQFGERFPIRILVIAHARQGLRARIILRFVIADGDEMIGGAHAEN